MHEENVDLDEIEPEEAEISVEEALFKSEISSNFYILWLLI